MVDYIRAIKRPFSNIKILLIGILLNIIPIVNLINIGYYLECAKNAMNKKFKLPEWKSFWNLFVRGLVSLIIMIIYLLPAAILFIWGLVSIGLGIVMNLVNSNDFVVLSNLFVNGGPLVLIGLLLFVIAAYIIPMALVNYSTRYQFRDAFDFNIIFKKILTGKYLLVWLIASIIIFLLTLIFGFIPFIGYAISGFISLVIAYTLYGEVYKEIK